MTCRPIAVTVCSLAAVALLSGCGERKESLSPGAGEPLRVALAPVNLGESALFAQMTVAPDAATAIRRVQDGKADLAIGTEPDLLEARGRGARVVSVAALVQSPFQALIGPKLSVSSVLDLATKPIGTQGLDYQRAFAETIFKRANVVDVGMDPSGALTSKKVAAVIAPFGGPSLPPGVGVVTVDRLKVPTFSEYVLVANQDALGRDDETIRSFIGALARGTRNLSAAGKVGVALPLSAQEAARIRALMLPPRGRPYGWHDATRWRKFADWMRAHGLPQKGAAGAFTNRLLPGEGL
jgi:putative hydroxymethylpyrimidine transport system substrate-binding protein